MVFATLWEAQANVAQTLRSVTAGQILELAEEKYHMAVTRSNIPQAMKGEEATFKNHPQTNLAVTSPKIGTPGPSCSEMK
jgi:hypothetical protein